MPFEVNGEDPKTTGHCYRAVSSFVRKMRWVWRGGLAVLDQGLFSGTNFLVNLLLARWLPPEEYGAFAVAYSIFLFLAAFHTAVLTEPMLVFGAGRYRDKFPKYLGILLHGHWGFTGLIALILALAALVFWHLGSLSIAWTLGGLAAAAPFLLLLWLARRACYTDVRLGWAALGDAVYLFLTLITMVALFKMGYLASYTALLGWGFASLIAGAGLVLCISPRISDWQDNPTPRTVLADHWGYGSWNVLATALYWLSGQVILVLAPIFLGLGASAAMAAVWNLFRPWSLAMQSLSLILLPLFAGKAANTATGEPIGRTFWTWFFVIVGATFAYGLVVSLFSPQILHLLYAGRYDGYNVLVLLFALSMTASAAIQVSTIALKSTGDMLRVVTIWSVSAATVPVVSIPFMKTMGLNGALIGFLVSYLIASVRALLVVQTRRTK